MDTYNAPIKGRERQICDNLTLVLLNLYESYLENSVDPGNLASAKANV